MSGSDRAHCHRYVHVCIDLHVHVCVDFVCADIDFVCAAFKSRYMLPNSVALRDEWKRQGTLPQVCTCVCVTFVCAACKNKHILQHAVALRDEWKRQSTLPLLCVQHARQTHTFRYSCLHTHVCMCMCVC
jgi:hypothetical protein